MTTRTCHKNTTTNFTKKALFLAFVAGMIGGTVTRAWANRPVTTCEWPRPCSETSMKPVYKPCIWPNCLYVFPNA